MTTKLEEIKSKIEKTRELIIKLEEEIKAEEAEEVLEAEFAGKLAVAQDQIAAAVKGILDTAGLKLPVGKTICITSNKAGILTANYYQEDKPRFPDRDDPDKKKRLQDESARLRAAKLADDYKKRLGLLIEQRNAISEAGLKG